MTTAAVHLIPLVCAHCRQPLAAQPGEVAWVCEICGEGSLLDVDGVTRALSVFYAPNLPQGAKGRPFWVAEGRVTVTTRETYRGNESKAASEFWGAPRLFFIPAYAVALEEIVATGVNMLRQPGIPQPAAGSRAAILPVTTPPEDFQPLAEFIVLAIEADRRDALKTVNFSVQFAEPQLWVLP